MQNAASWIWIQFASFPTTICPFNCVPFLIPNLLHKPANSASSFSTIWERFPRHIFMPSCRKQVWRPSSPYSLDIILFTDILSRLSQVRFYGAIVHTKVLIATSPLVHCCSLVWLRAQTNFKDIFREAAGVPVGLLQVNLFSRPYPLPRLSRVLRLLLVLVLLSVQPAVSS